MASAIDSNRSSLRVCSLPSAPSRAHDSSANIHALTDIARREERTSAVAANNMPHLLTPEEVLAFACFSYTTEDLSDEDSLEEVFEKAIKKARAKQESIWRKTEERFRRSREASNKRMLELSDSVSETMKLSEEVRQNTFELALKSLDRGFLCVCIRLFTRVKNWFVSLFS